MKRLAAVIITVAFLFGISTTAVFAEGENSDDTNQSKPSASQTESDNKKDTSSKSENSSQNSKMTEHNLTALNMKLSLPSDMYVLKRGSKQDSASLKAYKLTEKEVENTLKSANLYLMASPEDFSYNINVSMTEDSDSKTINSFSDLNKSELEEIANSLVKQDIYTGCSQKTYDNILFLRLTYKTTENKQDVWGVQNYTVINGQKINITLQSYGSEISKQQEQIFEKVMQSVKFTEIKPQENQSDNTSEIVLLIILISIASLVCIFFVVLLVLILTKKLDLKKVMKKVSASEDDNKPESKSTAQSNAKAVTSAAEKPKKDEQKTPAQSNTKVTNPAEQNKTSKKEPSHFDEVFGKNKKQETVNKNASNSVDETAETSVLESKDKKPSTPKSDKTIAPKSEKNVGSMELEEIKVDNVTVQKQPTHETKENSLKIFLGKIKNAVVADSSEQSADEIPTEKSETVERADTSSTDTANGSKAESSNITKNNPKENTEKAAEQQDRTIKNTEATVEKQDNPAEATKEITEEQENAPENAETNADKQQEQPAETSEDDSKQQENIVEQSEVKAKKEEAISQYEKLFGKKAPVSADTQKQADENPNNSNYEERFGNIGGTTVNISTETITISPETQKAAERHVSRFEKLFGAKKPASLATKDKKEAIADTADAEEAEATKQPETEEAPKPAEPETKIEEKADNTKAEPIEEDKPSDNKQEETSEKTKVEAETKADSDDDSDSFFLNLEDTSSSNTAFKTKFGGSIIFEKPIPSENVDIHNKKPQNTVPRFEDAQTSAQSNNFEPVTFDPNTIDTGSRFEKLFGKKSPTVISQPQTPATDNNKASKGIEVDFDAANPIQPKSDESTIIKLGKIKIEKPKHRRK